MKDENYKIPAIFSAGIVVGLLISLLLNKMQKAQIKSTNELSQCLAEQQELLIQSNQWGRELYECKLFGCEPDLKYSAEELDKIYRID